MAAEGILFMIVLSDAAAQFLGLLTWAEQRTRKRD